jgi:hypothetical protein
MDVCFGLGILYVRIMSVTPLNPILKLGHDSRRHGSIVSRLSWTKTYHPAANNYIQILELLTLDPQYLTLLESPSLQFPSQQV